MEERIIEMLNSQDVEIQILAMLWAEQLTDDELKSAKHKAVKTQRFWSAAKLRDVQRERERNEQAIDKQDP